MALHARTAAQRYSGTADWSAIARLREAVPAEVPVLGNGDVFSAADALAMIRKHTSLVLSSIGSGPEADVIFLFMSDLTGGTEQPPRHARAWGNLQSLQRQMDTERRKALRAYRNEVVSGQFPDASVSGFMAASERAKLAELLDKRKPLHS